MISQSGNVAVNALGSRRGIGFHTVVSTGNQAVLDASDWLAALAERRRRRLGRAVPRVRRRRRQARRGAGALRRARDRRRRAQGRRLGGAARAPRPPTPARSPATSASSAALVEEAGAAWAADPHELLELARVLAEPRARPRGDGGLAVLTCSGGDSGLAADEARAARARAAARSRRRPRERLAALLPERRDGRQPARLHVADLGRDRAPAPRSSRRSAHDPAIDQLLLCYDHPRGLAPEHEAEWAARARGRSPTGALESGAASLFASTLPDLLDEARPASSPAAASPTVAGLATALVCAVALRAPPGRPRPAARDRGGRGARGGPAAATADGWLGEAEAKAIAARTPGSRCRRAAWSPTPTARSSSPASSAARSR